MSEFVGFRRAKAGDAGGIEALVASAVGPWMDKSEIRSEVVQCASDPNSGCQTVAVGGGRVVGHVMVQRKAGAFAHVGVVSVCVAPELRRRGIGSALLGMAEEWARKHGVMRLEAICNVQDHATNGLFHKAQYVLEAMAMWAYARNPAGELVTGQQWARYILVQSPAAQVAQ